MREIKFEYGFQGVNGIIKKVYYLSEIPNIKDKCDVWNELPIIYVRQFTGLQDKNGVDIYEGDIVCIIKDRFGVGKHEVWSIEYGYFGDAAFYVQNNINSGRSIEVEQIAYFSPDGTEIIELEVIGNIHENKL